MIETRLIAIFKLLPSYCSDIKSAHLLWPPSRSWSLTSNSSHHFNGIFRQNSPCFSLIWWELWRLKEIWLLLIHGISNSGLKSTSRSFFHRYLLTGRSILQSSFPWKWTNTYITVDNNTVSASIAIINWRGHLWSWIHCCWCRICSQHAVRPKTLTE